MLNFIFKLIFIIITIVILIKTIYYGIYEINTLKNKTGGLVIITFSIITVILANIVLFLR